MRQCRTGQGREIKINLIPELQHILFAPAVSCFDIPGDVLDFKVNEAAEATPLSLPAQVQLLNDSLVAVRVFPVEIIQQRPTFANHLQKTTAGMVILFVSLQVLGQELDLLGKDTDLNFWRTSVTLVGGQTGNDL